MYFGEDAVNYEIDVIDDSEVQKNNLYIVHKMTSNKSENIGHQSGDVGNIGESLIASSDCASCHKKEDKSIGPSYLDIAKKYSNVDQATAYLAEKIRLGGSGNWGENAMAAHPNITLSEATLIVDWILSLDDKESKKQPSLPMVGKVINKINPKEPNNRISNLSVSYTDLPTNKSKPLSVLKNIFLRSNIFEAQELNTNGFENIKVSYKVVKALPTDQGTITFEELDLSEVKQIRLDLSGNIKADSTFTFDFVDMSDKRTISSTKADKAGVISIPVRTAKAGMGNYQIKCTNNAKTKVAGYIRKLTFSKV
jgi:cytochrome c551/c552